ncbi:UDP-N-acetylmuramate--L-alanine ligase [Desertivirga xinjiangensis]|uniref:UDP-N-acetylmuramate--L-alanine ligase n=1 Tax=Desertivirga xinjiangensis TaxID=539206 RepID=UPI00210D1833|nr:UDP-N-acetylmuramate--L-alanine ligase [Pedobacter xinjiangensis]
MELSTIKQVYLVGIGGIGMSGLARYFQKRGCEVCGYDRTRTALTDALEAEGIAITFTDSAEEIPVRFREKDPSLLVIYTPAIPRDSAILNYFADKGFELKKRSEVLGIISKGMFTIAVAGTHGKTTTSTIVAHILKHSKFDCTAFLGGIASNYNSNILFGDNDVMVVEADEYDRSFLRLHPDIAIITSMDADHLDIYGDDEHVKESFRLFAAQLKKGGRLIHKQGLPLESGDFKYSAGQTAEVQATNVQIKEGTFFFDFVNAEHHIQDIEFGLPGLHNIENATAAIQAALLLDIDPEKIKAALKDFRGVKRRFEYILKTGNTVFIDDYAHHPEELRACIAGVRRLYPDKKLTVLFQPHLYSRTRDFAEGFAEVLDTADHLILLDIYPARELPIPGVSSEIISGKMILDNKEICGKDEALEIVKNSKPELLLTVGAGDIDTLIRPLKEILENV